MASSWMTALSIDTRVLQEVKEAYQELEGAGNLPSSMMSYVNNPQERKAPELRPDYVIKRNGTREPPGG